MPVQVGVQVIVDPGVTLIADAFFASAERLRNMQPLLRDMVELISTEIDLNFQMQGRPDKWPALADSTLQRRAFTGLTKDQRSNFKLGTSEFRSQVFSGLASGVMILEDTGELRQSAVNPDNWTISSFGQTGVAELPDPTGYGMFHVTGASGRHGELPIRDWTFVSDEALDEMENNILQTIGGDL